MPQLARLNNSILGWMLIPLNEASKPVVGEMYAKPFDDMRPSERAFMKGKPVTDALGHIKQVAADLKIGLSACGNPQRPTLRLWWTPPVPFVADQFKVDLKWACWSAHKGIWDNYIPGLWDRMEKAFTGESLPVIVTTAPRKEIYYGRVVITKGKAEGNFSNGWDDLESLADTLGTTVTPDFEEAVPYSAILDERGVDWDFKIKARLFASLMRRIDREEDNLINHSEREWKFIETCYKKKQRTPTAKERNKS